MMAHPTVDPPVPYWTMVRIIVTWWLWLELFNLVTFIARHDVGRCPVTRNLYNVVTWLAERCQISNVIRTARGTRDHVMRVQVRQFEMLVTSQTHLLVALERLATKF
jgi:hypothetical protein